MRSFNHLFNHFKMYGFRHKYLYLASVMLLFWAIFDGIISYVTPIAISQSGFSNTIMGIIIGSSSVAGALFDFILSKYLQTSHWRRLYLVMFIVCLIYPLFLLQSKIILLYLIAMSLWGLYYDLLNFGNFDFVSRELDKEEHSSSFGVLGIFKSSGYLLAPLIVGFVIGESLNWRPFVIAWIFLLLAIIFFIILFTQGKKKSKSDRLSVYKPKGFMVEIGLWKKIGKILLPFLIFTMLLSMHDSFFWTIGPILSESFVNFKPLDGLFLTFYSLPPLLVGWFVDRYKKLAGTGAGFKSFTISSTLLIGFAFLKHPVILLIIIFVSSVFSTFAWAIEQGKFADYIDDSVSREKEIEGLVDFSVNIGYIIGPILAGFLSDIVGYFNTFALLGGLSVIIAPILSKYAPKRVVKVI